MPYYLVRQIAGQREELPCLIQLEDENAAMYFNIIYGAKLRRRFTTWKNDRRCADYLLVAAEHQAARIDGRARSRAVRAGVTVATGGHPGS